MPRRPPSGGEGATGGESATEGESATGGESATEGEGATGGEGAAGGESADDIGHAFLQMAKGLKRIHEALQLQEQEAMRRQEEAERRHQEAMRRQEQEAEQRLQEALRLQEERAASALRDAVGQTDTNLQENAGIHALEQRLEETQQRVAALEWMEQALEVLRGQEVPMRVSWSPPTTTATRRQEEAGAGQGAAEESKELQRQRVEERMQKAKETMMATRANPSQLGEDLHTAVENGNLTDVQRLLDAGADVNYLNWHGYTTLMRALVTPQREEMVSLLLREGADPNAVNVHGGSALLLAAEHDRDGQCVNMLADAGADVNVRTRRGATPLHCAAINDNTSAVRALLLHGAKRDVKGWKGRWKNKTPFDLAKTLEITALLRL